MVLGGVGGGSGQGGAGGVGGGSGQGGAGGVGGGGSLVFCDNPDTAAPSCSIPGYSPSDESALRAKIEGCAVAGCHGTGSAVTAWTLDLSGSIENALAPLSNVVTTSGYYLIDELDPDCSDLLTQVTDRPAGGIREPIVGPYWSQDEIDCFRSYLNELYPSSRCDEVCSLPGECVVELGIPFQGGNCMTDCQAQVEVSGSACINAILDTIACLGTCDLESLSQAELLACQDEALVIETACE